MATPITWQNVNAPSANPAAALGAASSAFGRAGQGFDSLTESLRVGKDRAKSDRTNAALSQMMADGKMTPEDLANLPSDINADQIMERYDASRTTDASVAASGARTDLNQAQARSAEFENSAPERERRQEQQRIENNIAQSNADSAASRAASAASGAKIAQSGLDTQEDIKTLIGRTNSEEPGGLRHAGKQALGADWPEILSDMRKSPEIKNLPNDTAKDAAVEAWASANYEDYLGDAIKEIRPGWLAENQVELRLTAGDIAQTPAGALQSRANKIIDEVTAATATAGEVKRKADARRAKTTADNKAYHNLVQEGGTWRLGTAAEVKGQKLFKKDIGQTLEDLDLDLDSRDRKKLDELLEDLGGNESAFIEALMGNGHDAIDRDRGLVPYDNDDIKWNLVNLRKNGMLSSMQGVIDGLAKDPVAQGGRPSLQQWRQKRGIAQAEAQATTPEVVVPVSTTPPVPAWQPDPRI